MRRMLRSPVAPALSRMSGLWTRPSIPMMKLTFTFALVADRVIKGEGVVRAWGGSTCPQLEGDAVTWGTSLNCAAWTSGLQATSSRSARVAGRTVGTGAFAFAKVSVDAAIDAARIRIGQRRGMSSSPYPKGSGIL